MRRLASASAVLALVGGLLLAPMPAHAATDPFDFTPSPNKPRAYLLNIMGKVLGPVTPKAWQRETLANQHRYNFGWETLDAQLGGGVKNGAYLTNPQTFDDYVIANAEQQFGKTPVAVKTETAGKPARRTAGGPFAAPATRAARFEKAVGGALAAYTGAQLGFMAGKDIAQAFGMSEYGLCEPTFEDFGFIASITGTDCSPFDMPQDFEANSDVNPGVTWGQVCQPGGTPCATLLDWGMHTDGFQRKKNVLIFNSNAPNGSSGWWVRLAPNSEGCASSTPCDVTFTLTAATNNTFYQNAVTMWDESTWSHVSGNQIGTYATTTNRIVIQGIRAGSTGSFTSPTTIPVDPERTLSCAITGDNGITYTSTSAPYNETDGELPPPVCPDLPAGVTPYNIAVSQNGPNGSSVVYDEDTTAEYRDLAENFPQCMTGSCLQDLIYVPEDRSCTDEDLIATCANWFTDPDRDTKYQCTYGGEPVEVQNCYIYAGLFLPGRIDAGAPYSDPLTGEWSGGQNAPTPSKTVYGEGVLDPDQERDCFPEGWARLNPVEWVVKPVQCALQWAFVPRPAVVAVETARSAEAWSTTPVAVVASSVEGWGVDLNAGGCQGPPVDTGIFTPDLPGGEVLYPLSACSEPAATWATVSSIGLGITFSVLGVLALIRQWGGVVGQRGIGAQA